MLKNKNLPLLLIILAFFSTTSLFSQQFPNSGFEEWAGNFKGTAQPTSWNGSNVDQSGAVATVLRKVSESHSGSGAAQLTNERAEVLSIGETSPAWMTIGRPFAYISGLNVSSATAGTEGGLSFNFRPDTMSVWVKRTSNTNEDFNLVFYSWTGTAKGSKYLNKGGGCSNTSRTDEESDIRIATDGNSCGTDVPGNQVGEAHYRARTTINSWTQIKVPVKYYNNDVPEKANIILSAGNYPNFRASTGIYTGTRLIVDDLSLIYSSKIHEIRLNGRPMADFNVNTLNYEYVLSEEATDADIPVITCFRSGRSLSGSEIAIDYAGIDEDTKITVKAEDGSSTTVYNVKFIRTKSTNANPSSILINGVEIPNFNAYVKNYNVVLPYGTTDAPEITVVKAEDAQTFEVNTCVAPCTATVKVYAHDTSVSNSYTINLSVGELTDNTLETILINDAPINNFVPTTNTYIVEMPVGTTVDPTIKAVSAYADGDQNIVVTNNGLNGTSTIVVTPPSGVARTYRISYLITESSYSYLNDLKVGGITLQDFAPATLSYDYALPVGTTELPEISWSQGDVYQTVEKVEDGVNGTTKITVKSQKGNSSIYRINFSTAKSSNAKLSNIYIDGTAIAGFNADQTDYSYQVDGSATTRPVVTFDKGDATQIVSKNPSNEAFAAVVGTTKLTVRAEDGSLMVYNINFSQTISDNSKLADLSVANNTLVPSFNADVTDYTCALERGTTVLPIINYVAGDATQTIRVVEGGVNGKTTINVRSQSGSTTVYNIQFSVGVSSNSALSDIKIAGASIDNFDAATLSYDYVLPSGTINLPAIEAVKSDYAQTVIINKGGVNGATKINVFAEDGSETVYTINFSVEKSANAELEMIYLDGIELQGFEKSILSYTVILKESAGSSPRITVLSGAGQYVEIVQPALVGLATITVTPEVGANNVYTINFKHQESSNSLLADLQVGGISLPGFNSSIFEYNYQLADGTTTLPSINAVKVDETQVISIVRGGLNSATIVSVRAQDGAISNYKINFSIVKSSVATLNDIKLDGTSIAGFDSNVFNYNVELAQGLSACPAIAVVKADENQIIEILTPNIYGDLKIKVVSSDQSNSNVYTINLNEAKNTDATLNSISVNGSDIANFDSNVFDYNINVEYTTDAPIIAYQKNDATQSVVVSNNGFNGCVIKVTAQNGAVNTYTLTYTVTTSSNTLLSDIQVYDDIAQTYASLPGFDENVFDYNVELPWRLSRVPTLNAVTKDNQQIVTINYGGVNGATTINVVAGNGSTALYTINFSTIKSDVALLNSISVDGIEVPSFDANVFEYNVTLPYGTIKVPAIGYQKALHNDGTTIGEQKVIVNAANIYNQSTITVIAENGSQSVYKLNFSVAQSPSSNELIALNYGNKAIAFTSGDYDSYEVKLPYGTTEIPELSVVKNYDKQSVYIIKDVIGKSTKIIVKSNYVGIADTEYSVLFTEDLPKYVLSDLSVDNGGALYPDFDPSITQYVALVNDTVHDIKYQFNADNCEARITDESTSNKRYIVVEDKYDALKATTYTVSVHYVNDVIPNGEFTRWDNNNKPSDWSVPHDIVDDRSKGVVNKSDGQILLKTSWNAGLGGVVPAVVSLGKLTGSLAVAGKSQFYYSGGGINFRNTPDNVSFKYKYSDKSGNGALFDFEFDGQRAASFVETSESSSYKVKTLALDLSTKSPSLMTIAIDSRNRAASNSEWENFMQGFKKAKSELYVDFFRFAYSDTISSIKLNGNKVVIGSDITNLASSIDAEYFGNPKLDIVGKVIDQSYGISWVKESANKKVCTIKSYAEDGKFKEYIINVTRPVSTIAYPKSISVAGVALSDFAIDKYDYIVELENGVRDFSDIQVITASAYQTVSFINGENKVDVKVAAEDGNFRTYTINFVEKKASDATLVGLAVEGYSLSYDPATADYSIELPANTTVLPNISFDKQSDGQTVVMTEGGVNGKSTLLVTAEDGITQNTYSIDFSVANETTTKQLSSIVVVGGEDLGFDANVYEYAYQLQDKNEVEVGYTKAFASDSVITSVSKDSIVWTVFNGDASLRYKLNFNEYLSDDAQLKDILVNGVSISSPNAFDPLTTEYSVDFITGDNLPSIEPIANDQAQAIAISFDQVNKVYSIDVTAENGTNNQYNITLNTVYNNNSDLKDIIINGVALDGFDPNVLEYNYELKYEGTNKVLRPEFPSIEVVDGSYGQSVDIETNGINGITYIIVTAENGSTKKVYEIQFNEQKSDNALLNALYVKNKLVENYQSGVFNYTCYIDANETVPVVAYEKANEFETVSETINGDTVLINVKAEDGITENTYKVVFDRTYSSNSELRAILLDNVLLQGFNSSVFEYSVELPVRTEVLPIISVTSGANGQSVDIVTNGVNGDAIITVTAEDGVSQSVYTIHFSVKKSDVATLNNIYANNVSIDGFDSNVFNYNIQLPVGTAVYPEVTYELGDIDQTASLTYNADSTLVTIDVIAHNQIATNQYVLNFEILKSEVDTLTDILLDDISLEGFTANKTNYDISLPVGTAKYPEVTYVAGDIYQTVAVNYSADSTNVNISVVAENGNTKNYVLNFEILKSTNADLLDLMVDGVTITGFEPTKYTYNYVLAVGTTELPVIDYVQGDQWQTASVESNGINGAYIITTLAGDGISTEKYIIQFSVAKSENAKLADLLVNGLTIDGFDPDVFTYSYELAFGATQLPAVEYVKAEDVQEVVYSPAINLTDTAVMIVKAEDRSIENVYEIVFSVAKSNNSQLAMIYADGSEIEGFDASNLDYTISLPYGTTEYPEISWLDGDQGQIVNTTVSADQSFITISVQSEDNMSFTDYTIQFIVEQSDETRLSDIMIFGETIEGFDELTEVYEIEYPAGTPESELPSVDDVTYVKYDEIQNVEVAKDADNGNIVLTVTAQNGAIRTYVIISSVALFDNALLSDISINGVTLEGFDPYTFEYQYKLPFGAAAVPDSITYVLGEEHQTAMLSVNQIDMPTEIYVTAQDPTITNVYRIHFVVDEFDPATVPTKDNVCITSTPSGAWKFTTDCSNVTVYLVDVVGRILAVQDLELVDPNCVDICAPDAKGFEYTSFESQVVLYYFLHKRAHKIESGKFRGIKL